MEVEASPNLTKVVAQYAASPEELERFPQAADYIWERIDGEIRQHAERNELRMLGKIHHYEEDTEETEVLPARHIFRGVCLAEALA